MPTHPPYRDLIFTLEPAAPTSQRKLARSIAVPGPNNSAWAAAMHLLALLRVGDAVLDMRFTGPPCRLVQGLLAELRWDVGPGESVVVDGSAAREALEHAGITLDATSDPCYILHALFMLLDRAPAPPIPPTSLDSRLTVSVSWTCGVCRTPLENHYYAALSHNLLPRRFAAPHLTLPYHPSTPLPVALLKALYSRSERARCSSCDARTHHLPWLAGGDMLVVKLEKAGKAEEAEKMKMEMEGGLRYGGGAFALAGVIGRVGGEYVLRVGGQVVDLSGIYDARAYPHAVRDEIAFFERVEKSGAPF